MPATRPPAVLARLTAAVRPDATADRDLLRAFVAHRSEPAFAELVRRHGPLVLGVCRRALGHAHDAEDAFQATFLVLARKAKAVGDPDRLPGWLHTIAVRTATEIRRMRDRRRKLEQANPERKRGGDTSYHPVATAPGSPEQSELAALLDEELAKLPEHYRVPVVLCELQGLSRKDVAARLDVPEGTLSSRLAKARKLLADRLARRGVAASAAAVAAALANEASARVPAGLLAEATRGAVAALAGEAGRAVSLAAVHAADGVVKALFVNKLKGLACALGVLAACAGVATVPGGRGAAGDDPPAPRAAADPDPAALVKRLGSAGFADREAAERQLRALGEKAKPALLAGTKDADPEVARRCEAILKHIREADRQAFLAGKREPISPAWKRFKELVGDTEASRKLFAEMIADDRRAQALDKAAADPAEAAKLYAAEVERVEQAGKKAFARFIGMAASPEGGKAIQKASREAVPPADVVAVLFLGSFPLPDRVSDPAKVDSVLKASFIDLAGGPQKEPFRKLFVAWLDRRRDPGAIETGLEGALYGAIPEAVPIARRLAADAKAPAPVTGAALLVIGTHGTADDLPRLAAHRTDARPHFEYTTVRKEHFEVQVREVAAAMSLQLRGQDFEKYGFERIDYLAWWVGPDPAPFRGVQWFPTAEARDAALKKAWDWLDKQPKPAPKAERPDPDPAALVKQLGSAVFAERDAAEAKLKELGARARAAILAGSKDADPEVARRCQALLDRLRADELWPRFAKLIGEDEESRKLFRMIVGNPKNVELLEAIAARPDDARKLYFDRRAELNKAARVEQGPGSYTTREIPLADVAGWFYLGTFPGTGGDRNDSAELAFLPTAGSWKSSGWAIAKAGGEVPFRRLVVKWAEQRSQDDGLRTALRFALEYDAPELADVARNALKLKDADVNVLNRGWALIVVGKFGTKADVPPVLKFADDANRCTAIILDPPGQVLPGYRRAQEGKDVTIQVRDVAVPMALKLLGQNPVEFGLVRPVEKGRHDPFSVLSYGFKTAADRTAAHKKARDWLDKQPKPEPKAPDAPKPDPEAEGLVRQLGSQVFADRDAAEAKLKELGPKARAAVLAGTRDADPEVARRSAAVLDHLRAAGRAEFARLFRDRTDGPLAVEHPTWTRFKRITGDTKAARDLFAAVIADDARFRRLEEAEEDPAAAPRLYAAQFPAASTDPARSADAFQPADLAAALLLGTFPGTAAKLPERREEDLCQRNGFVESLAGPFGAPLRKLYPAWLAARTDADVLASGLETARACGVGECLPLARRLAADPKAGLRTRTDALLVVGRFGTPEDVPLARPLLTETSRYGTFVIGDPARAQVRDIAAAVMLMVHGQKPSEFGFSCGTVTSPIRHTEYEIVYGFRSDEARAAGHRAVLAYVEAAGKRTAAKPEPAAPAGKPADLKQFLADFRADADGVKDFDHPLWKRFTAAAGSDKAARVLFAAVVADPDRAARLAAAAADPASAGQLYAAEVERVRKYAEAFNAEFVKRSAGIKDPMERYRATRKYLEEIDPPLGEVGAMLFLGTFPASADASLSRPYRVLIDAVPVGLAAVPRTATPWAPAARRLFAAWLATRGVGDDREDGLNAAAAAEVAEVLPLARRWAADPLKSPRLRGLCLPIIARFGTAADRPLADALHDDAIGLQTVILGGKFPNPPGPKEGTSYTATVGDVALAVSVHLAGGNPFEFGFGPPQNKSFSINVAWGSLGSLGFTDQESRTAAHRKAKEWLARVDAERSGGPGSRPE